MAVILITHDLTVVRQFADRVYVMQHGEVKEHNATEALFRHPQHAYTKRLLSSEPKGVAKPLEGKQRSILKGKDVRVTYTLKKGGIFNATYHDLHAVDGLSLDVKRGETLGLVGESGSGKTTFGQALIRLLNPQAGEITFDGNRIDGLDRAGLRPFRARMQIVFQDPFSSMNPRMNVRQIIEEGLIVNAIGSRTPTGWTACGRHWKTPACPRTFSRASRTSSPAASASVSPSRGPLPWNRNSSCWTSPLRT